MAQNQMSSEEALNGIFNILETMIIQEEKDNKKIKNNESDKTIIDLLNGIVEKAKDKAAASVGQQLEQLSKGLKSMKEIDKDALDTVATSITRINKLLNNLHVPNDIEDNMDNFISAINKLGNIKESTAENLVNFIQKLHLENIQTEIKNTEAIFGIVQSLCYLTQSDLSKLSENLEHLDERDAEKLGNFIFKLINSVEKSLKDLDGNNINKLLEPLSNLMYGLQAIVNTNIFKMKISLNPIKGYLLGRQIGQFLHAIMKRIKDDHINESVKYISDILTPLSKFADPNEKNSIKNLRKALSKRNARKIGAFFSELIETLPDKKESAEAMASVANVLVTLTAVGVWGSVKFVIFTSTFTEERAKKISTFFKTLCSGDWDSKKLKNVNEFITTFGKLLKSLTFILAIVVALVAFFPITAVLSGFLLMSLSIHFVRNIIKDIITHLHKKDIKKADKVINSITKLILATAGLMAFMAILSAVIGPGPVLLGFAMIGLLLAGVTVMIKQLADKKLHSGIKHAASAINAIAILLGVATLSIIALTLLIENTRITSLILGLAVVSTIVMGSYLLIKKLAKIKSKDLKHASNALWSIAKSIAVVSAAAMLFKYIGEPKTVVATALGEIIVLSVVSAGIGMVWLLTHIKNKDLKHATNALFKISLILAGVALITNYVLKPIGKDATEAIIGASITLGILGLLIGGVWLLSKITKHKSLNKAVRTLAVLTLLYAGLGILMKVIIIPLGEEAGPAFLGSSVVLMTLGLLIGGIWLLSRVDLKNMLKATIYTVAMAIIYLGLGLIIKEIIIPIGEKAEEALFGSLITLTVLISLIGGIWLLSRIDLDNMAKAGAYMVAIAFILLGLSLIVKEIIIPIGEKAEETLYGSLLVLGLTAVFGLMMLGIGLLLKTPGVKLAMAQGALFMAGVGIILLILGKFLKSFANSAVEVWKLNGSKPLGPVVYGAGLIVTIVGIMGLIMYALGKIAKKKSLLKNIVGGGLLAMAIGALADIVAGEMWLFAKAAASIYNMNKDNAVIWGGLLIIGILGVMTTIFGILGALSETVGVAAVVGGIVALIIGALADIVAGEMWLFAWMCKKVNDLNKDNAVINGGLLIISIFGIMTTILGILGSFGLIAGVAAIIGGTIGTIIGALADIITGQVWIICKISASVTALNKNKAVEKGFDTMVLALDKLSSIAKKLAKMTIIIPLATLGAGVVAVLTPLILGASALVTLYINIASKLITIGNDVITETGDKLILLFETVYKIAEAANPGLMGAWNTVVSDVFILPLMALMEFCSYAVNKILDINSKITVDEMIKFKEIIVGKDEDDPNSLLGCIKAILDGFPHLGKYITKFIELAFCKGGVKDIFDIVSQFIDVVMKVATMNYITGYDDNGKPIYEHLDPDNFGKAATNVTNGFLEFMTKLSDGFEDISIKAIEVLSFFSGDIRNVIETVSRYVDVIMKVATGTYITGYDDNGNPEYEHMTAEDFGKAAEKVTESFTRFIQSLNDGFGSLGLKSIAVIKALDDNMKPVMESVGMFIDAVCKVATLQIITGYDENGNPEYEQLSMEEFTTAGITLTKLFTDFVKQLGEGFKNMSSDTIYAIESLDDNMKPIMDSISSFVDAILKLASGQYIDRYDQDKNGDYTVPHFVKINKEQYEAAADVITEQFGKFIKSLTDNFSGNIFYSKTQDALEAISDSIKPVMDSLSSYIDSILKLATGVYVEKYEKDNKGNWVPIYKKLTKEQLNDAATNMAGQFIGFIKALEKNFKDETFRKNVEELADMMSGTVKPVMEAVKMFSESLEPFMNLTTNAKDQAPTKDDYLCLQNGVIKQMAEGIAHAFTSFISIIADEFSRDDNKKKYESLLKISDTIKKVMEKIKKIVKSFSDIIKSMAGMTNNENETQGNINAEIYGGDFNGNMPQMQSSQNKKPTLENAPYYAGVLSNALVSFLNIFTKTNFSVDNLKKTKETATALDKCLKSIKDGVKTFKDVLDNLDQEPDKTRTLIEGFDSNLNLVTENIKTELEKAQDINFIKLMTMLSGYLNLATVFTQLKKVLEKGNTSEYVKNFIDNLKTLTSADMSNSMKSSGGPLKLYTNRLKEFTNQVQVTTSKVKIYVTTMERATKAMKSFDDEIINKEKKRNEALDALSERITKISNAVYDLTNAVYDMSDAFEYVNETDILSMFKGTQDLIEKVTGITQSENETETGGSNTRQSSDRPRPERPTRRMQQQSDMGQQGQRGGNNNTYIQQGRGFGGSGTVIFNFKNHSLFGDYTIR